MHFFSSRYLLSNFTPSLNYFIFLFKLAFRQALNTRLLALFIVLINVYILQTIVFILFYEILVFIRSIDILPPDTIISKKFTF